MATLQSPLSSKHLVALGRVTANFSQLEDELHRFAWDLLATDLATGQIITAELSFKNLLNLISSLGQHLFADKPLMRELEDALRKAASAEDERNTVAHSIWFSSSSDDDVYRMKITAKRKAGRRVHHEQVAPEQIEQVAHRIAEATFDVMQVHAKHR